MAVVAKRTNKSKSLLTYEKKSILKTAAMLTHLSLLFSRVIKFA